MSELKRCPFCGGEAKLMKFPKCERKYVVICENVQCMASVGNYSYSKEKAIEAWNTRKPLERIVERLDSRRKEYEEASNHPSIELPQECYYKGIMRGYEYSRDIVKEEGE